MKHNSFRTQFRKEVESLCKVYDFTNLYVDENNNTRKIYIYTLDWMFVGSFELWVGNDSFHISFSTNQEKVCGTANREKEIRGSYLKFGEAIKLMEDAFKIMD